MYEYSYEKVKCGITGWGGLNGTVYGIENFQDIIDAKASNGWRYIGFIPTKQRGGTGHIEELTLVFEMELKKEKE